ncbi:MAG: helix-turn-helix domain-containing protein [bacterium]|nr:helix-turn-helix domain-containing protein [bacterium]
MPDDFPLLDARGFQERYIDPAPHDVPLQDTPLQIYPLAWSAKVIRYPTLIHRIPYNYLVVVREGFVEQQLDNQFYRIEKNDVILAREGQLSALLDMSPDVDGYFIHVANSVLPRVCPDEMQLKFFSIREHLSLRPDELAWVMRCADLLSESATTDPRDFSVEFALLQALLRRIYGASNESFAPVNRGAELCFQFKQLVYASYRDQREVGFYAAELAVSENYLNRCVKKLTGKSAKEYINEVAIYQSQVLLQDMTREIADVAYALNFSDPSYYGRLFKRVTGSTPREYRAGLSHDSSD